MIDRQAMIVRTENIFLTSLIFIQHDKKPSKIEQTLKHF